MLYPARHPAPAAAVTPEVPLLASPICAAKRAARCCAFAIRSYLPHIGLSLPEHFLSLIEPFDVAIYHKLFSLRRFDVWVFLYIFHVDFGLPTRTVAKYFMLPL